MLKFTVLFAAILIPIQIQSGLSGAISEKDDVKLADLSHQFSSVLENQTHNIDKAAITLQILVEKHKKSLQFDLQQLRQYIEETAIQAVEENRDISTCLKERTDQISFKQIDLCNQKDLIEYCRKVLIYLTKEHDTILLDMNRCNQQKNDSVTIDSCRYSNICQLRNAIKNADILITSLLEIAYSSAFQCSKISVMKINHNITSLAKKFTTCSDVIMEFI